MRGTDKLMEPVDGAPLIINRWHMLCGIEAGASDRLVILPSDRPARLAAVERADARIVINEHASTGLSSSIKTALSAVPSRCTAALFLPADMPEITRADIAALRKEHEIAPNAIIRAASQTGQPGNPVLFPRDYFAELQNISGDEGGKQVIARNANSVRLVTLPGNHATLDLDTPEDWAAWRETRSR